MRHRRRKSRLGLTGSHRKAMLRQLVIDLVKHGRIETTLKRAKEASRLADKMVTFAKRGDLASRRQIISRLSCPDTAAKLIKDVAPVFTEVKGGYTRVLKYRLRKGDAGQTAILEFSKPVYAKEEEGKKKKKKKSEKSEEALKTKDQEKAKHKKSQKGAETSSDDQQEEGEAPKKGGFLSGLRKFLKGDE